MHIKKIAVVTATRAEYGLLKPVIQKLREYENNEFQVDLIVTGTHLSDRYGRTIQEIEQDALRIDREIAVSIESDDAMAIAKNQAEYLVKFTEMFAEGKYSGIVVLGDRYEMLAISIAAANMKIPIFHLCGGDTTEGAIDEWIRHSITKMGYLHFSTNEESKRRIIQLGEAPERVFNYGSTSIDNILRMELYSIDEAFYRVKLNPCEFALCTYHPVTMENESPDAKLNALLEVVRQHSELQFIFTKSNADCGGAVINKLLDEAAVKITNLHVYSSLGVKLYLSLMKHAEFVLGNSSSGIIETPAFHIPTVNVGDRQRGRLQSGSIINCAEDTDSIMKAVDKAMSDEFKKKCLEVISPYGEGKAAEQIAKKIFEAVMAEKIDLKKKFYDL